MEKGFSREEAKTALQNILSNCLAAEDYKEKAEDKLSHWIGNNLIEDDSWREDDATVKEMFEAIMPDVEEAYLAETQRKEFGTSSYIGAWSDNVGRCREALVYFTFKAKSDEEALRKVFFKQVIEGVYKKKTFEEFKVVFEEDNEDTCGHLLVRYSDDLEESLGAASKSNVSEDVQIMVVWFIIQMYGEGPYIAYFKNNTTNQFVYNFTDLTLYEEWI